MKMEQIFFDSKTKIKWKYRNVKWNFTGQNRDNLFFAEKKNRNGTVFSSGAVAKIKFMFPINV
jgi:hypothetical protein